MRPGARLVGAALLVCACEPGPPPYGFAAQPEQRFRLETEELTLVDDEPVNVKSYAEFRLVAEALDEGGATELSLYLERYYQSVERSEGMSEVAISREGVLVRGGERGELQLRADQPTSTAPSIGALLDRPAASAILSSRGVVTGQLFHSYDPLLAGVHPLQWFLLAAPVLSDGDATSWSGSREVPQIGQYRLGVQLPLRYERAAGEPVRATGFVRRPDVTLAEGFRGELELDFRGEVELGIQRELLAATSELELAFDAQDGSRIRSRHRVRIQCRDCAGAVNSEAEEPDQAGE